MKKIQYAFNFIGGGWNSEWAANKRQAIKQAQEKYVNKPNLVIDKKSFKKMTPELEETLLMNFW